MRLMDTKAVREWRIERPWVCFGWSFAVPALLLCVCTPFMDELPGNRWAFFGMGLGYSAGLAFFSTGVFVLPPQKRKLAFLILWTALGIAMLWAGTMLVFLPLKDAAKIMWLLDKASLPMLSLLGLAGASLFCFSCHGWFCRLGDGERR